MDGHSPGYPWDDPRTYYEDPFYKIEKERESFEEKIKIEKSKNCQLYFYCVHIKRLKKRIRAIKNEYQKNYDALYEKYLDVRAENIKLRKQIDPNYSPIKRIEKKL